MDNTPSPKLPIKELKTSSFSRLKANCGIVTKQISGKLLGRIYTDGKGMPCNKMYHINSHKFYLKPLGDRCYSIIILTDKFYGTSIQDLYPHGNP